MCRAYYDDAILDAQEGPQMSQGKPVAFSYVTVCLQFRCRLPAWLPLTSVWTQSASNCWIELLVQNATISSHYRNIQRVTVAENRSRLSPTTVVWRYPVGNRNLGTRLVSFLENWSDWTIELPDLTPYPSVTDRRTDRRVCYIDIAFCIHKRMRFDRRAIKTRMTIAKEAGI